MSVKLGEARKRAFARDFLRYPQDWEIGHKLEGYVPEFSPP